MRMIVLLATLALATAAEAQPPSRATLDRQAEAFLRSCDGLAGDDVTWCTINRTGFAGTYRRAYAGDYNAQRNVAFLLRGSSPGVVANHVDSCAWRLVIIAQRHPQIDASDTANVRFDCGRLDMRQRAAAQERALALVGQIAVDPARR